MFLVFCFGPYVIIYKGKKKVCYASKEAHRITDDQAKNKYKCLGYDHKTGYRKKNATAKSGIVQVFLATTLAFLNFLTPLPRTRLAYMLRLVRLSVRPLRWACLEDIVSPRIHTKSSCTFLILLNQKEFLFILQIKLLLSRIVIQKFHFRK